MKNKNYIILTLFFAAFFGHDLECIAEFKDKNVQILNSGNLNKCAVENNLRHSVLLAGYPTQKMNIVERMDYYKTPAVSIAIINDGKIDWASGFGNITHDKLSRPVDEHTLFQAGSVSKSLTAFGVLLLVQQEKLDLDKDVNEYLESWKIPNNELTKTEKVTLRRLLSHTAGTDVHGFPGYSINNPIPTTLDILDGNKPLVNTDPVRVILKPGTEFRYSGGGTTIIQLLIEDITGESFDIWMQKNVLIPLEMMDSTFEQPLSEAHASFAAYGHYQNGSKVEGNWHIYPEKAAAGLWTTPTDLAKYVLYIQNTLNSKKGPLLDHLLVNEMITRQFPTTGSKEPGLGFFINNQGENLAFVHRGQDEGFIASLYGFANRNQGFIIMMNNDSGWALMEEISNSIADTYKWPNFTPIKKESVPLNPSILRNFQGNFTHDDDKIQISIIDNKPYIEFKKGYVAVMYGFGNRIQLFPKDDYSYFIQEANITIEFIRSSDKIIGLTLIDTNEKTNFTKSES